MTKILFVCLGNICRSPIAKGIFETILKENGVESHFYVDSCGTSDFHEGEEADPRTRETLDKNNISLNHEARQLRESDFREFDYIIAMDEKNYDDILEQKPEDSKAKILMLRAFEEEASEDINVPDPYWSGPDGFDHVFEVIDRNARNLLNYLLKKHKT